MPQLSQEQKELFGHYIKSYERWLKTPEGKQNLEEHREHNNFFSTKLSVENIDNINEAKFREIYKKLWASNIWGNKDWYIDNKLLKPNGLPKIKQELKKLLYREEDISTRFDNFRQTVKGFGPSSISEILHFVFPSKHCLWNDKPKTVLPFLKIDLLPERFFKYNLQRGSDYSHCLSVLGLLKDELSNYGFSNPDFIDLDCVLWHTFNNIPEIEEPPKDPQKEPHRTKHISTHEEAEYYLLTLGKLLDYLTYTADGSKMFNETTLGDCAILQDIPDFAGQRDKNSARQIDVIWFDEDENPKFCIEVEHTTDITKGLHRLLQLEHFHVTFVIVATEDKRSKYEIEMNKSPFRKMKERYKFISYEEVLELCEAALNYKKLRDTLLG